MAKNLRQNRKFELTIQVIKLGQISFINKAAQLYNISQNILYIQLKKTM